MGDLSLPPRLLPLVVLVTAAWLMIFAGSYAIFQLIVPLPDVSPRPEGRLLTSLIKVGASGLIALLWLYVMLRLRNFYVYRRLLGKPEDE